uniref:Uncharacterized protein n=1 Tax=Arundo donax TaxID=35708 RepID=A0A0A9ESA0_ARUDO
MCTLGVVGSLQIIGSLHMQLIHLGVNYFPLKLKISLSMSFLVHQTRE